MEAFSSKDMALRAQKKILSKMATKASVQMFIDDTTSEILDELYHVSKEYSGSKSEAQKVIKNLIKIAVKIGVLFRNNRFSTEELSTAQDFKKKLHQGAMTAISFYEVWCHKASRVKNGTPWYIVLHIVYSGLTSSQRDYSGKCNPVLAQAHRLTDPAAGQNQQVLGLSWS